MNKRLENQINKIYKKVFNEVLNSVTSNNSHYDLNHIKRNAEEYVNLIETYNKLGIK